MESFFGIGGPELLLILVLATIVLGPLNMIKMARQFGILMRDLRNYYQSLTANLSQELGDLAELEDTLRGQVNASLPKPEELQVAVPNLMAEAQQVLNTSAPNQPAIESSEPASPEVEATTPVQIEAGPGGPGTYEGRLQDAAGRLVLGVGVGIVPRRREHPPAARESAGAHQREGIGAGGVAM